VIHHYDCGSHRQREAESFEHIETFYSRKRQHSTLKYKFPVKYLDDWIKAQDRQKQVAYKHYLLEDENRGKLVNLRSFHCARR